MRKGSAFPASTAPTHREATPRAGGIASKKSKAATERQSLSALSGGKAAKQPRGKASKQQRSTVVKRARRPQSQHAAEGLRTINDYSRDELVAALLKGMGKKWWTRDDAIRAAAGRLGFHRTGSLIRDAFKSAINGAIRRGLLEYEGTMVRRAK